MNINTLTLNSPDFPDVLRHIPQPPGQLYTTGTPLSELMKRKRVAVIGARAITPYGRQVTALLARQLAEQGIVIVSGLALGVDACAQQAAVDAGGQVIAVLPSPLDNIVPVTNYRLAQKILATGGTWVSEYAIGNDTFKHNFIERNRLMSGLADAVLIIEAAEGSGSLHTADFAADQGVTVMIVPGNITSRMSKGTNGLLRVGAVPIMSYLDVLDVLGVERSTASHNAGHGASKHEQLVLNLIIAGTHDGNHLLASSNLAASKFNQAITMLEIDGRIKPLGANNWGLT